MASVETSKPITSLKIHVDNDLPNEENQGTDSNESDEEMEEGEASEDEVEVNVIVAKPLRPILDKDSNSYQEEKPFHKFKKDTLRKHSSDIRQSKDAYEEDANFELPINEDVLKEERASRFGIPLSETHVPRSDLLKLYKSLEIDEDDFNRGGWRSDAVHMRGIEGMYTEDIFEYFKKYSPRNIEWLTSNSCNVVWLRKNDAARALLGLSCPIFPSIKKTKNNSVDKKRRPTKETEKINVSIQKPQAPLKGQIAKKPKEKPENSKTPSEKSSSSSESSDSSDSEDDNDNSSASSEDSSSSSSSGDSDSSSSSSDGDSSSDSSSDSEDESTKMETDEMLKVKKIKPASPVPKPVSKESMEVEVSKSDAEFVLDGSVAADDIGVPVPSGQWRLGVPCPFTKAIFLRFAHCKDKKVPGLKKPVELNKKISSKSLKYRSPPKQLHSMRSSDLYKPDIYDKPMHVPPPQPPMMPEFPSEKDTRSYRDLDDPFKEMSNPWGYLAQNWDRRETQDSLDYHALLREHVTGGKKRKPDFSSESEEERETIHKRLRRPIKMRYRDADYSQVSPPQEYQEEEDVKSDVSDDVVPWKSKNRFPRMRMYADAEEKKKVSRKPMGDVLDRIGGSRERTWLADNPRNVRTYSQNRNFDLRAKLQSRKRSQRVSNRGSYSESE